MDKLLESILVSLSMKIKKSSIKASLNSTLEIRKNFYEMFVFCHCFTLAIVPQRTAVLIIVIITKTMKFFFKICIFFILSFVLIWRSTAPISYPSRIICPPLAPHGKFSSSATGQLVILIFSKIT